MPQTVFHLRGGVATEMPVVEGIYRIERKTPAPDRWFVIFTDPLSEKRVSQALVARAVTHYLPRLRRWKRQSARAKHQREPKRQMTAPLLTRYVFAALPADALHYGAISDIDGVHSILSDSKGPLPVTEELVVDIGRREAAGEFDDTVPREVHTRRGSAMVQVPKWVEIGMSIAVKRGPYAGFPAVIEDVLSTDLLKVGVTIFGRIMPVDLPLDQLDVV